VSTQADEEIGFLSAVAARDKLSSGALRAEHYIAALLRRISDLNGACSAFASVSAPAALEAARKADRQREQGGKLGPLHGVPFAVKDLIDIGGEPTLANSRVPMSCAASSTAAAVARLQSLGAIYMGKLALEEFGIGSQLDDPSEMRPKNPWDLNRSPGGSSSGSAVAVAAGMVPLALSTDTTGSTRAPAAYCGIVGLKPTRGRVSQNGVHALAPTLDTIGLMARSAGDCALLFSGAVRHPVAFPLLPARIAWIDLGPMEARLSPDVRASMLAALGQFASLGCSVFETGPLPLREMRRAARIIQQREAFLAHRQRLEEYGSLYQPQTRARLEAGAGTPDCEYHRALADRTQFAAAVDRLLETCDAFALPVTFDTAARFDDADAMTLAGDVAFRAPFSLTGHPAIVFCTGFDDDGPPLAMQLVGRSGEDERLMVLVHAFQQITAWHEQRPPIQSQA
jgi:aspartyl-tRNA(Asn)/glutamyl-tRNA(Gln) amidotransferase subunit A